MPKAVKVKIGRKYRFDYPSEFTTLPDYTAHSGQVVTVLRKLCKDEADPIYDEGKVVDVMYRIQADDDWLGSAWESELVPV